MLQDLVYSRLLWKALIRSGTPSKTIKGLPTTATIDARASHTYFTGNDVAIWTHKKFNTRGPQQCGGNKAVIHVHLEKLLRQYCRASRPSVSFLFGREKAYSHLPNSAWLIMDHEIIGYLDPGLPFIHPINISQWSSFVQANRCRRARRSGVHNYPDRPACARCFSLRSTGGLRRRRSTTYHQHEALAAVFDLDRCLWPPCICSVVMQHDNVDQWYSISFTVGCHS